MALSQRYGAPIRSKLKLLNSTLCSSGAPSLSKGISGTLELKVMCASNRAGLPTRPSSVGSLSSRNTTPECIAKVVITSSRRSAYVIFSIVERVSVCANKRMFGLVHAVVATVTL
jgi:hypothetical protein